MTTADHRYAAVNGQRLCYREAGPAGIRLLDGGHVLLESHLVAVGHSRGFLGRTLS